MTNMIRTQTCDAEVQTWDASFDSHASTITKEKLDARFSKMRQAVNVATKADERIARLSAEVAEKGLLCMRLEEELEVLKRNTEAARASLKDTDACKRRVETSLTRAVQERGILQKEHTSAQNDLQEWARKLERVTSRITSVKRTCMERRESLNRCVQEERTETDRLHRIAAEASDRRQNAQRAAAEAEAEMAKEEIEERQRTSALAEIRATSRRHQDQLRKAKESAEAFIGSMYHEWGKEMEEYDSRRRSIMSARSRRITKQAAIEKTLMCAC